jgi:hypothetical protein
MHYEEILGRTAAKDIERGTPIAADMIDGVKWEEVVYTGEK